MNLISAKNDIITLRQGEFDYLRGGFMLFIYLIHAFQATQSAESALFQGIYIFATMSGAAIFIFVRLKVLNAVSVAEKKADSITSAIIAMIKPKSSINLK